MSRYFRAHDNVVAIPFPLRPRRVVYGELGRVFDFIKWKRQMTKPNGNGDQDEEILNLPPAEQKLWLIQKMFEVLKEADTDDLEALYKALTRKDKPPEGA